MNKYSLNLHFGLKNILAIYFTQTGQAKLALDAVLKPFEGRADYKIHYELLKPRHPLPYPWKFTEFCDVFPENVQGIPFELEPIEADVKTDFDLVFIVYQPWFLSICRPVNSFLLSVEARRLLRGKPVITIINCRNMWLSAQEKMKQRLLELEANLVGNITFVDKSANLTSLVTVLAFELKGVKENYLGLFPRYGVSDKDLANAPAIGQFIESALRDNDFSKLQDKIVEKGFVSVKSNLMLLEGRGKALFPIYANYISKKGTAGSADRKTRVRIFGFVLPTAILILSPIITVLSRLAPLIVPGKMKKQVAYYQQNSLKSGKS
jgi:hypothetical protein